LCDSRGNVTAGYAITSCVESRPREKEIRAHLPDVLKALFSRFFDMLTIITVTANDGACDLAIATEEVVYLHGRSNGLSFYTGPCMGSILSTKARKELIYVTYDFQSHNQHLLKSTARRCG
jgi:hypothetical protein